MSKRPQKEGSPLQPWSRLIPQEGPKFYNDYPKHILTPDKDLTDLESQLNAFENSMLARYANADHLRADLAKQRDKLRGRKTVSRPAYQPKHNNDDINWWGWTKKGVKFYVTCMVGTLLVTATLHYRQVLDVGQTFWQEWRSDHYTSRATEQTERIAPNEAPTWPSVELKTERHKCDTDVTWEFHYQDKDSRWLQQSVVIPQGHHRNINVGPNVDTSWMRVYFDCGEGAEEPRASRDIKPGNFVKHGSTSIKWVE